MNNGARPTIWFRYVDDTFTLFHNKDAAVQFLYLNSRHKNIQFTTGQSDIHCKIKEALLIRDLKPALNENIGSEKLLLY